MVTVSPELELGVGCIIAAVSNSPVVPADPELDPALVSLLLPVIDSRKSDSDRLEDDDLDVKGS